MALHFPTDVDPVVKERFWAKVLIGGPDECWPWTANATEKGYGRFQYSKRSWGATHVALALDGRARPVGAYALHSCDNPPCVNPKHLRWGTHRDNMDDKIKRGRCSGLKGQANPCAMQVTPEIIARKQYIIDSPKSTRELAAELGIGATIIQNIRRGRKWAHIPYRGEFMPDLSKVGRPPQRKLSDEDVIFILESPLKCMQIAKQFNVSHGLISSLRLGKLRPSLFQKFKESRGEHLAGDKA